MADPKSLEGEYAPSPLKFAADQVALYESADGAEGNTLQGVPVIILTTRGRTSGALRKSPLMRVEHGGAYAVVASMGGAPRHPLWYGNLLANPDDVTVQDGANVYRMRAREVTGDEKATWWQRAVEVWPSYNDYQARTTRVIPVVVLEPR
jgi:deazaflavin-dependent oxidoreductase (nitroreductase family)